MHFAEMNVGDFRIYAGALEAVGGYVAAVVVNQVRGGTPGTLPKEVYRDTAMSGGHRWGRPEDALSYAVTHTRNLLLCEGERFVS